MYQAHELESVRYILLVLALSKCNLDSMRRRCATRVIAEVAHVLHQCYYLLIGACEHIICT